MGHSCRAHSSYETSSKSHAARLQDERFVRDFLQKSRVKSQKRAFRTRLPPKVTRQVSKTSVSYETSSKSHASSLKNIEKRAFRTRLPQKSHVKSPKRAFRTRLPPKVTRQVPKTSVSYETSSKTHMSTVRKTNVSHETSSKSPAETPIGAHISRSPAKQFRDSSPSKRHANPNVTATFHNSHNLPIPCACHESFRRPHV